MRSDKFTHGGPGSEQKSREIQTIRNFWFLHYWETMPVQTCWQNKQNSFFMSELGRVDLPQSMFTFCYLLFNEPIKTINNVRDFNVISYLMHSNISNTFLSQFYFSVEPCSCEQMRKLKKPAWKISKNDQRPNCARKIRGENITSQQILAKGELVKCNFVPFFVLAGLLFLSR